MRFPFSRALKIFYNVHFAKYDGWVFSNERKRLYIIEKPTWERNYLPISVKGKIVLDVGAGEGETAKFFLDHGAEKVICIEPDPKAFKLLELNARNRNMVCLNKNSVYPT